MRTVIPIFFFLFLIVWGINGLLTGCNKTAKKDVPTRTEKELIQQTIDERKIIHLLDSSLISQQNTLLSKQSDIIQMQRDSINLLLKTDCTRLQKRCDSLRSALAIQNFRVGRIQYYVNICNRKPSQDKFLRGWINRTLK